PLDPNRHGTLYHALPWSVLDFFDFGAVASYEKDHIDQDSCPLLDQIVSKITSLSSTFQRTGKLETNELKDLKLLLEKIEKEKEPIKIFYSNLANREATAAFEKQQQAEQERIDQAKEKAQTSAQQYKDKAIELIKLIAPRAEGGIGPEDKEIVSQLTQFKKICDQAKYHEKGVLAKAFSVISDQLFQIADKVKETYLKADKPSDEAEASGKHPLAQLLTILSDTSAGSSTTKQEKIQDALSRLEQSDLSFQGVQAIVESQVPPPYTDVEGLWRALHHFLMRPFLHQVNPEEFLLDAYAHAYSIGRKLIKDPLPKGFSVSAEIRWILQHIKTNQQDQGAKTLAAATFIEAELQYRDELMKIYNNAASKGVDGAPQRSATDDEKIKWVTTNRLSLPQKGVDILNSNDLKKTRDKAAGQFSSSGSTSKKLEEAKVQRNHIRQLKLEFVEQNRKDLERIEDPRLKNALALINELKEVEKERQGLIGQIIGEAKKLGITVPEQEIDWEEWIKELKILEKHQGNRHFVRLVYRAQGKVKTENDINLDLLAFYDHAAQQKMDNIPDGL
ncbi:MAG: hypothetical protein KDK63_04725, partial [Chlamydiia bacterium]|nr:hypothetical protein [Chlamydiia bacterium]